MALQHLRSSTANKRPLPGSMSDGQLAINTNTASPGLFFKDSAGALIKVGPVHVGSTAPNVSPAGGGQTGNTVGEQWLDTSGTNPVLKIWDGSAWQSEAGEFVNASGDTMTGALVMDNQQQVRFRETTANGTNYIAIQAPASVSADRTLTLPDVTGTLVSTGDTGSVTSTMILDGTIVNADVNASAAIAGTKINPDFGSQNITTSGNIAATNQGDIRLGEATANGSNYIALQAPASLAADITYTLPSADGTSGQVLSTNGSGTLSWAAISGSSITQGNTSAEVIDTGTDGRFVVTTEGTERTRVTSDGVQCYNQPAEATYTAGATLTVSDLKTGIVSYTGGAATFTLPTGTDTEAGFSNIYTNMAFQWSMQHIGAGNVTLNGNTNHTITGSNVIGASVTARFVTRRTASNTFVTYRLS